MARYKRHEGPGARMCSVAGRCTWQRKNGLRKHEDSIATREQRGAFALFAHYRKWGTAAGDGSLAAWHSVQAGCTGPAGCTGSTAAGAAQLYSLRVAWPAQGARPAQGAGRRAWCTTGAGCRVPLGASSLQVVERLAGSQVAPPLQQHLFSRVQPLRGALHGPGQQGQAQEGGRGRWTNAACGKRTHAMHSALRTVAAAAAPTQHAPGCRACSAASAG